MALYYLRSGRMLYDMQVATIDKIATLLVETTRILSNKFQLTLEEINDALPLIDTSKTDIWKMCPAALKPSPCPKTRFRTIDGSCSSMKNSVWGMTNAPLFSSLPPSYDDGFGKPRSMSVTNTPLPNVRKVSVNLHQDLSRLSGEHSTLLMSWGQFITHDLASSGALREENGTRITCCPQKVHPLCAPITVSEDDPFYSRYGATCLNFVRTVAGIRSGCALGPRAQLNALTTRIDANSIYGPTSAATQSLRVGSKGLLKLWDKFHDLGLKELMPLMTETPDVDCIGRPRRKFCFTSGDERVNIQPESVVLHTLFTRYHNTIAKALTNLNPHWDDERLFQESRHILIAVLQHLDFNEFVPLVLGPWYTKMYNLTIEKEGYWYGYDENTPMVTLTSFQTAAFRFGHSMVHSRLRFYNKHHEFVDSDDFHYHLRQPYVLYNPGTVDKIVAEVLDSAPQSFDRYMSSELTRHLFQPPNEQYGNDLASLNTNRGRDHGIRGYNDYREWCGMPRIQTFEELENFMGNGTGLRYSHVYKHPDDIDLWSAGLSEPHVEGGVVGPTFACIQARQFNILRKADRFWYENPGLPSSFTPDQLREIKKMTIAKVLCDNSDDIQTLQMWALKVPHPTHNPRVHCKDLPAINLEYWKENPPKKPFLYP